MAQRKQIGIIFSYSEGWIGGTYYVLNIIEALKTLPEHEKPFLEVFVRKTEEAEIIRKINYPFLGFSLIKQGYDSGDYSMFQRLINKISLKFSERLIFDKRPKDEDLVICFPNPTGYHFEHLSKEKKIHWIPDFQEHHLPDFFSEEEVQVRKNHQQSHIDNHSSIVFSSLDAQKDFFEIYPKADNQTFILNFAVTHPKYAHLEIDTLRKKFDLPKVYFFSPNQFWAHKNQIIILKAIKLLKEQGIECIVAFSGKMHDYRNPEYSEYLIKFAEENTLSDNVRFLGFIDRAEQLKLMSKAIAVVQPSLFEGWSTVVEDAKAINQFLILSNLGVHKEQVKENALFFDPKDEQDLAAKMMEVWNNHPIVNSLDYSQHIAKFAHDFIAISNRTIN